ncbi:MAG TPA: sugar ABC transporter substrate-binding protein [Firmicutes bacterium]|jgi:ABC-type glycerol-3-phosphate transport system substrate-binding protein|nr:sugar ABC transporter substrate-binding protein [Bacillota bacterium]
MRRPKLTIVLCGILFVTGCFGSQDHELHTNKFETIHLLGTVGVHEMIVELIEEKLAADGIKVEKNFFYWDTYMAKARQAILNETGEYDVIIGPNSVLSRFMRSGKLIALNDLAEQAGLCPDDLYPPILDSIIFQDKWYSLPYLADVLVYIYRQDLFDRKGITPPQNITQMYQTARLLTTDPIYGLAFPANPDDPVTSIWSYFLWSYGGDYFTDDGQPIIDSAQSVAATRIYSLILANCAPPAVATWKTEEAVDYFLGGNLAAMILWSSAIPVLNNSEKKGCGEVGCAPLPLGPTANAISPLASWGMVIPRSAKHIIAAKKFAATLVSNETLSTIAEKGMGPTPLPKINREYAPDNLEKPLSIAVKALEKAKAWPSHLEANQYIPIIGSVLNDILMGADTKTTLEAANKQLALLVARRNQGN